jgi:hypothetical protein
MSALSGVVADLFPLLTGLGAGVFITRSNPLGTQNDVERRGRGGYALSELNMDPEAGGGPCANHPSDANGRLYPLGFACQGPASYPLKGERLVRAETGRGLPGICVACADHLAAVGSPVVPVRVQIAMSAAAHREIPATGVIRALPLAPVVAGAHVVTTAGSSRAGR